MLSKTVFDGVRKMVCGLVGRRIAQEYPPRPKAEPRSGRRVRGVGLRGRRGRDLIGGGSGCRNSVGAIYEGIYARAER